MFLHDCIPADIGAVRSKEPYWCEMCHKTEHVTILQYPITKNFGEGRLSQVRRELWMCDECREKVIRALMSDNHDE